MAKNKMIAYYRRQDASTSEAYKIGRQFEYRAMHTLFMQGWHCMRRFGSHGVKFCGKCGRHVHRAATKCLHCNTDKFVMKASLDFTAYKEGVYLMISCKFSGRRATAYLDDGLWYNLVTYSNIYGALPVFAGITEERGVYFVNLLTLKNLSPKFFDNPSKYLTSEFVGVSDVQKCRQSPKNKKPDEQMVQRLIDEAWAVIDYCNTILADETVKAGVKARWATIKVQMLNVINRSLYSAGLNVSPDDLAKAFMDADKIGTDVEQAETEAIKIREKQRKDAEKTKAGELGVNA